MYKNKRFKQLNLNGIMPFLPVIGFSLIFIIGLLAGSILVGKFHNLYEYSGSVIREFLTIRQDLNFLQIAYHSAICCFPVYLFTFVLGTSFVGCVAIPILVLFVGIIYGLISGNLYMSHQLEGIMFNGLILLPMVLAMLFGLFLLSKEAFFFSVRLANICINTNKPINIYTDFKIYCIKSISTLLGLFISIVFDICLSSLFISYFNFT